MIKVYKFGPAFGLPDASPFVHKVETYLRMTDQKYETVTGDVRKAPRTQLPFVEVDGKVIPDSTVIVDHLEAARPEKLDAHLDAGQRAIARAFQSMLEEHLYFGLLFLRWVTDDGWTVFEPSLREIARKDGRPVALSAGSCPASARQAHRRPNAHAGARSAAAHRGRRPDLHEDAIDALADHMGDPALLLRRRAHDLLSATVYAFAAGTLCPRVRQRKVRQARRDEEEPRVLRGAHEGPVLGRSERRFQGHASHTGLSRAQMRCFAWPSSRRRRPRPSPRAR